MKISWTFEAKMPDPNETDLEKVMVTVEGHDGKRRIQVSHRIEIKPMFGKKKNVYGWTWMRPYIAWAPFPDPYDGPDKMKEAK